MGGSLEVGTSYDAILHRALDRLTPYLESSILADAQTMAVSHSLRIWSSLDPNLRCG